MVASLIVVVALVSVGYFIVFGFHSVIQRIPIPGTKVEVTFLQEKPLFGGPTEFQVEFGNGAVTKEWLDSTQVTAEQIRSNCRVEYDGQTLRILGPRSSDWIEVPGFRP